MTLVFHQQIGEKKFSFEKITDGNGEITYYIKADSGIRPFFMVKDNKGAGWKIAHPSMVPEKVIELEDHLSETITQNSK